MRRAELLIAIEAALPGGRESIGLHALVELLFGRIFGAEHERAHRAVRAAVVELERAGRAEFIRGGGAARFQGYVRRPIEARA